MLEIKYIRENAKAIQKAAQEKNIKIDIDELLKIDDQRRKLQAEIDNLRAKRNKLAQAGKGGKPTTEQIEQGREIKFKISEKEKRFRKIEDSYLELMVKVPTIHSPDTPVGKDDSENIEVLRWQEPTKLDFTPKDYMTLARDLDLIDFDRGVKVSGYRGYYLKNEAVLLVMGMMMHAIEKLIAKGFTPIIPPTIVREFVLFGSGYFAGRDYNPESDEIYQLATRDKDAQGSIDKEKKFLVGTAEPSLLAYYANEVLDEKDLPIKFCGFSQCYRSEIGSYGKDTKGIYRVHEFMKVEQVTICRANLEESDKYHQEMVSISEELHQELGLPYRKLFICSGDLAAGKYKMFDLEAWIPSRNAYGETGSASNFVDWQARRLNVRYKDKQGNIKPVYMLNNTALANVRPLIAILENYQQKDGSIKVPRVLQKYVGKKVIGNNSIK
jgi:seryl-tRNA synthetase